MVFSPILKFEVGKNCGDLKSIDMRFSDSGIIINVRKYSESALIVKVLSQEHGLYSGFIKTSFSSKKSQALYQNFNLVEFEWSSRNEDSLGYFKFELKKSFLSHIISSPLKLSALNIILAIINENILERETNYELFDSLLELLEDLKKDDHFFLRNYIKFEIKLLEILGYGIDLSTCVATGETDNLHFVSPKSARAVSREAGEKYRDKLLILPQFLIDEEMIIEPKDLVNGFHLSGFFINKHLVENSIYKDKTTILKLRSGVIDLILKN